MPLVAAYYRPESLSEALTLLAEPNRIPLGGGTVINADRQASDVEVVDLQALGLNTIVEREGRVEIGATATLAQVAAAGAVPPGLGQIAQAEEPSTLRTIATIGGTVASLDPESVLLAALLVHDTQVAFAGAEDVSLVDVLTAGVPAGAIITSITIDPSGELAIAATGRTPADVPIVAAVGRKHADGISLALTGVALTPILVTPDDPTNALTPPADFRGSSEYRLELASVLSARVIGELA